jgi:hypothetical protein
MGPADLERSPTDKAVHAEVDFAKNAGPGSEQFATHYAPAGEAEKHLDRKINLKLDFIVLLILAVSFIVRSRPRPELISSYAGIADILKLCGIDKTNVGFVATSSFIKDANLQPDDVPTSLSLVSHLRRRAQQSASSH